MIPITNSKLVGLEPRWAPFRGVSLVFENPADDVFFRALREGLAAMNRDSLIAERYLRLLPLKTHHVTVWDGVNDGKMKDVVPEYRDAWERFLQTIPATSFPEELFREVRESELLTCPDWDLRLQYAKIENWSDVSLVARLAPADAASAANLDRLRTRRDALSEAFGRKFGVRPHPDYTPHITLGYFANDGLAATSAGDVARWDASFREWLKGRSLTFRRVLLSAFTDMTSFGKDPA